MLDQAADLRRKAATRTGPRLDFQEHLADLEACGPRAADRHADQQGHRAASAGALAIRRRRAGRQAPRLRLHQRHRRQGPQIRHPGRGRRAGGLAANLRHRHGPQGRRDRRRLDGRDRQPDCAGRGQCRAVPGSRDHRRRSESAGRPRRVAGAGIDARLRLGAVSDRDAVRHPRSGERRAEHGHLPRRAQSRRSPRGAHGGARGDRRRRLSALAQIPRAQASRCRSPS